VIASAHFDAGDGVLLAVVVVLIATSAVFALAETSLVRMTRARAKALEDEGHIGARSLRRLADDPDRFLNPILLLVLLCQLVAATLVGVVSSSLFGPWGVAAATAFEVVVIFVFGEAVPKNWAVRHSARAALIAAPMITTIIRFPPIRILSRALVGFSNLITPGGRHKTANDVTESELLAMADVAVADDVIETEERQLIHSIIDFGDTVVREVMVPRPDIVAVGSTLEIGTVLERAIDAGYSRIPVYAEDLDDIAGIALTKDLIRAVRTGREHEHVGSLMRPAHYVPETKRVAPLMREMQAEQYHIAVVIDEYGGTAGLVTLEDLIEELVGEIVDEFDVSAPLIEPMPDGQYRVSGQISLDEVDELLDTNLPAGDWDTIGGLVMALLGHVPTEGESVVADGHLLVAERIQGRRISRVRIAPAPADHLDGPWDGERPDAGGQGREAQGGSAPPVSTRARGSAPGRYTGGDLDPRPPGSGGD
jgi:putative hemolysin